MLDSLENQEIVAAGADDLVELVQKLTTNPLIAMSMLALAAGEVLCHLAPSQPDRRRAAKKFGVLVADFAEVAAEARQDPALTRLTYPAA